MAKQSEGYPDEPTRFGPAALSQSQDVRELILQYCVAYPFSAIGMSVLRKYEP